MKRCSLGRQKIAIEKISKKSHLQVTFSKRRAGLFKKASELCTLCGVEIAIIVFSPAGKAFSFGHPEVGSVLKRFLARNPLGSISCQFIQADRNANVRELNVKLIHALNQLEAEKKRGEALNRMRKSSQSMCWWEAPVDELGLQELEQLRYALEDLKKNVAKEIDRVLGTTTSLPFLAGNSFRL
ncbi:mads box protein, putative [Ricinus communis]|uniref:Mads box protein, putative n=1 Tax=Ricinus communis TaxID=3988 RepID=B9SXJ4_RICCO|nr:mads box protein, putative [Ricinus communis]|eukprot:XP_002530713.1 agamous-like MADS-box protein AGL61 [Ricinus communis]